MAWMILVLAGLFEVAWAIGLKYTDGFTRLWPTAATTQPPRRSQRHAEGAGGTVMQV
jgi:Small Multidrug Resistance protein